MKWKNKKISVLVLCIMICSLVITPAFAGEGLYPSEQVSPVNTGIDITPSITEDGKTLYWSETLMKYLPEDQLFKKQEYPEVDKLWEKLNLLPTPARDMAVPGVVNEDTLILSGPSTPTKVFEDNGNISGGTKLNILYKENGYYFVENKENGVRGYLPVDKVTVTDTHKQVKTENVMTAATTVNKLGITVKNGSSFVSYPVYSQMNASSNYKIGSIGSTSAREIVQVISSDTVNGVVWYYIQYKTSSGYKNGYIQKSNIYIPTYSLTKPISSGTFTQDYGHNGHDGIDIGTNGTSVSAITSGTLQYKCAYKWTTLSNGQYQFTFVSYGRYAR